MGTCLAPAVPPSFVDREPVRARLAAELAACADGVARVSLHGAPGIGTSCVAHCFAHDHADRFDLVVYLAVDAGDPAAGSALGTLFEQALPQLGLAGEACPGRLAQQEGAYRHAVADRSVLVVLDGVRRPEVVRPLMPTAPGSMIVLTGRQRYELNELGGFLTVHVPELAAAAARRLLDRRLRTDLADIPEPTLTRLLELCSGHPMALQIVAGTLVGRPARADRLLRRLRRDGVAALHSDGTATLMLALDAACESLDGGSGAAYHLLSVLPGDDFGLEVAATALGRSAEDTEHLLDTLVAAGLLTENGDRFRFHPLVRGHAELRAVHSVPAERRHEVRAAAVEWYRVTGLAHEQVLIGSRWRANEAAYAAVQPIGDPGSPEVRRRALAFLDDELTNLEAAVTTAAAERLDEAARDLCILLWTPYHLHGRLGAAVDTYGRGIEAAERLGDRPATLQLHLQRGTVRQNVGEPAAAARDFQLALAAARECGHRAGEVSALERLGMVAAAAGEPAVAGRWFERAWSLLSDSDSDRRPRALLRMHWAPVLARQGHPAAAVDLVAPAVGYFRSIHEPDNEAKILLALGSALVDAGRGGQSSGPLTEALRLFCTDGSLRSQARTHEQLARVTTGEAAAGHRRAAREVYLRLGMADDARRAAG